MALAGTDLHALVADSASQAWRVIIKHALEITAKPLTVADAPREVVKRDREIAELDLFLSSCGWDLWQAFGTSVERTSERLVRWWAEPFSAKAVLVLDGLSLRELPWLVEGAKAHGFALHNATATGSELPGETDPFAQALGFGSRSRLQNNGAGTAHKLQPAQTETVDLPWQDCQRLVEGASGAKNWVFWHQWPDAKLHDAAGAGEGLETLTRDIAERLSSDDFWAFVACLAAGRRLVITSDHGYAATGYFSDADSEVAQFLKKTFASGRSKRGTEDTGPFVPPVALQVDNTHGEHMLALGRRKWRSAGGYPTLTHGGLSLLEVLSPFVELSK